MELFWFILRRLLAFVLAMSVTLIQNLKPFTQFPFVTRYVVAVYSSRSSIHLVAPSSDDNINVNGGREC